MKKAISAIKDLGGSITIEEKNPDKPVNSVSLAFYQMVSDAALTHLNSLKTVKNLNLDRTFVTDRGLIYLKGLTQLQSLNLTYTRITDDGLVHLKGMTKLQTLNLEDTRVSDTGLIHLKVYDPAAYMATIRRKNPAIVPFLQPRQSEA